MPGDKAASLLLYAMEEEETAKLFQRWVVQAQYEMSFEEFRAALKPKKKKTEKEILRDVEGILKDWEVANGIV